MTELKPFHTVFLLLTADGSVEGVYYREHDAQVDADYLGRNRRVEEWVVDYETVAVAE